MANEDNTYNALRRAPFLDVLTYVESIDKWWLFDTDALEKHILPLGWNQDDFVTVYLKHYTDEIYERG